MKDLGPDPQYLPPALSAQEAEALAVRHELDLVGRRPSLPAYLRQVWRHRHLMWQLAKGEFAGEHQDNYLGFLWAILNPLLLGLAYFLIFGLFLGTSRGIEHFITFLTAGLFTYALFSTSLTSGSKALLSKQRMVRSLQFPRVILPIVTVISAFISQLPAFGVLLIIAGIEQKGVSWTWLLFPVALLIVTVMGMGIAMLTSRLVHGARDLANLMPLIVRLLRYISGVFFSIELQLERFESAHPAIGAVLEFQPAAVTLTLVRETLMVTQPLRAETWLVSIGWALVFLVGGFIVFWRGEGSYGRA